jgi:hypothetical protein
VACRAGRAASINSAVRVCTHAFVQNLRRGHYEIVADPNRRRSVPQTAEKTRVQEVWPAQYGPGHAPG